MTAIAAKPIQKKEPVAEPVSEEQHFYLCGVPWESYVAIGNALPDWPRLHITYDRGKMEFMTLSSKHEVFKWRLGHLVIIIAEELNRPIAPGGQMTMQREDLEKGIEGDDIFWIEHERHMRAKLTWEPGVDPSPDLALEIEISRSVINRLGIYAVLNIPEVWSFNGTAIIIRSLQADGTYQITEKSKAFPEIAVAEIVPFLFPDPNMDFLTALRQFRAWVRQILGKKS
jgi:hypothetical protein